MSYDDFWDGTNPGDVSIDTENSREMMVESHIAEQHTHRYQGPVPPELSNVAPNKPQAYDSPQNYHLDSSNKFKDLNIFSKTNNVTQSTVTDLLVKKIKTTTINGINNTFLVSTLVV